MGTLGHNSFEDDAALDCVDELIASTTPAKFAKSVVTAIRSTKTGIRDADDCTRAMAIAGGIAILRGQRLSHVSLSKIDVSNAGVEAFCGRPNLHVLTVPLINYSRSLERKLKKTCKESGLLSL